MLKFALSLLFLLSLSLSLSLPVQAYAPDTDVIVLKAGKWFRGWVLREDGDAHHLIAYNWNADNSERVENERIKLSTAPVAESKFVHGWASTEGTLWSLAISEDQRWMAVGAANGYVQVFEQASFFPVQRIPAWGKAIFGLSFSPDSQYLAACDYQGQVKIFDTQTWQLSHSFKPGSGCERLSFSAKGQLAISGNVAGTKSNHGLWLYSTTTKKLSPALLSEPADTRYLSALQFSPDGQYLAVGSSNRKKGTKVYQVLGLSIKEVKSLSSSGDVSALRFSPDGQYLVGGGSDNRVSLWKWRTGQRFWSVPWHQGQNRYVASIDFDPTGQKIAVCGMGSGAPVQIYKTGSGTKLSDIGKSSRMNCNGVRFSRDGKYLFTIRQVYSNFNEKIIDRYLVP